MTNKQMENRIKNLEEAVSALAGKTYARDTVNEGNISTNTSAIARVRVDTDTLTDYSTELLYELCLLKLGVEDSDV